MGLERYHEKRNFRQTPEPRGKVARSAAPRLRFVIQKHAARRLHYDFRLELDGVLKSWAVPRGPSLDPAEKRLAVHVEDHPLDYGDFEGIIPPKQYGAGKVLLWDQGVWTPEGDPEKAYRKGHLKFQLTGRKLHGSWSLIRMGGAAEEGKENWLLVKGHDEFVRSGQAAEITELMPESVASGREIAAIGTGEAPAGRAIENIPGARKKAMPEMLKPQLASLVDAPPTGGDWLYESKYDGYRMLARIAGKRARLYTRNGNDWTGKLGGLAQALARLPVKEGWLDGEIVVLKPDGTSDFQALQNGFEAGSDAGIVYYLFDAPHLDGYDLTHSPLIERKRLLEERLRDAEPALRYSDHVEAEGEAFYEQACRVGLEGIIAKRRDGGYVSTRSKTWVKVKCRREQEVVIGGYSEPAGSRQAFGALLIGVYDEKGDLHYAGKVGTGFSDRSLHSLHKRMRPLEIATPPFVDPPTGAEARGVHWLKPQLVAEISFAEWTQEGIVRQASFKGLREDKPARQVVREVAGRGVDDDTAPLPAPRKRPAVAARKRPPPMSHEVVATEAGSRGAAQKKNGSVVIGGIKLTNPERVLYPERELTKLALARYYESVAEWILPHLKNRPLTLVRCPEGHTKQCFYQKHIGENAPQAIEQVEIEESKGVELYPVANSLSAVIGLVQMGVLEIHTWGSSTDALERPDRMIFDLDPDVGLPWSQVVEAAQLTRALLTELGLKSFLKTTGGKGLHVVVPIQRKLGWDEVKGFSQAVAQHMTRAIPQRFTDKLPKREREKKIFIDYLRNGRGATAIAAFSTRAKPAAPVSVPLAWDELSVDLKSDYFNLENVGARLKHLREDPWADYWKTRQSITAQMKRKLGL
jgi:bifunctional non-homologous end joining protein LigD